MNKRTIVASLNKIANELDKNGLFSESSTVTKVMSRLAEEESDNNEPEPERKSHLQRVLGHYEREIKRQFEEIDNDYRRMMARKREFEYCLDDLDKKDRPAFEDAAQEILNKIMKSR